ncbi:MAG: putative signal transducing protein [Gammaproteobacteria bacterium]
MKRIYAAADLPEARLVLGLLLQQGIDAEIFNENAQGGVGEIPFTHAYPEIWLKNEADSDKAKLIIKTYEICSPDLNLIVCKHCGAESPENFSICWQCNEDIE